MPAQKLSIMHAKNSEFIGDGLRNCFEYRDLGIKEATAGDFHAHVIRAVKNKEARIGLHRHNEIKFQMVFILKGWMRFWYEGEGEVIAQEGTCILQPPAIKHDVLEWSDDLELLEVTSPADFSSEPLQHAIQA